MPTQSPTDFINDLIDSAKAECKKNLRKCGRGMQGEGKVEAKLPDGRTVVCTFSQTISIYGRDVPRSSFTIDGKRASKEQISVALGGRTRELVAELNPQLRAAFEAQAPELEADFVSHIQRVYAHQSEKFSGKIPAYPDVVKTDKYTYSAIRQTLSPHCDSYRPEGIKPWEFTAFLRLNENKLAKHAKQYADEAAVEWFYKTNHKLGKLDDATLVTDQGGDVIVRGTRNGKQIELVQQRILKSSVNGLLHHQFPARLYVQGKYVSEKQYKDMFDDEKGTGKN